MLDEFFAANQEIYRYFGYEPRWEDHPISDYRNFYWYLDPGGVLMSEENASTLLNYIEGENYDEYDFYTMAYVGYPADAIFLSSDYKYTMIVLDSGIGGNKYLAIFDNDKKVD